MIENNITTAEKSISEQIDELLPELSHNQMRFVVAMLDLGRGASKKEGAEMIGVKPDTVYRWNGVVDTVIELFRTQSVLVAQRIREQNLIKAMMVKVAGLDSDNERVRQAVASEIIEWALGKALVKQDITSDGKPIKGYISVSPDDWDDE
jgi:hypothetical protein